MKKRDDYIWSINGINPADDPRNDKRWPKDANGWYTLEPFENHEIMYKKAFIFKDCVIVPLKIIDDDVEQALYDAKYQALDQADAHEFD